MKKNKIVSFLLAISCLCGIGGATAAVSVSAEETATVSNQTLLLQSGYKSGMFAEVSKLKQYKGASVEFDLYESDFKDLPYEKSFDVSLSSGTSGSLACVSFVYGKLADVYPYDDQPQTPAWHTSNAYLSQEFNFGGFQYFCNGQIKEWSYQGNWKVITNYLGDPSSFMEEGNSYKVSLRYDEFEFEGETYGGSAWYCVEKKAIFEDESEYELLFAFEKQVMAGQNFTNGTVAGMEVQGLCIKANLASGNTSADGKGHSVNLEIDNLRIYDGVDYDSAKKKYTETFDSLTEADIAMPDMPGATVAINKHGENKYLEFPSKIRHISANHGSAMGVSEETTCRMGLGAKDLFTVTFKDKDTGAVVGTQTAYKGMDLRGTNIYSGENVYKFDFSEVDFNAMSGTTEIYGTPVSYFQMRLVSGVNDVNDKVQRVSVEGKFKLTADLLEREDYDLLGFTTQQSGGEVEYPVGLTVDMRCQDMTLYAVWQMRKYTTVYKVGDKTADTISTRPRVTPFYQGTTPKKSGYVFAGWSETIAPAQNNMTLTAQFVEMADVNAGNKVLRVKDNLTFRREGYNSTSEVTLSFDLIELPAGASISVLGADITEFVAANSKVLVSVLPLGQISVSKAYEGADSYTYTGSTQTEYNTNSYMTLELKGNIVLDTLTMRYDGENEYVENFEGIETISEGIYNNYYTVSGAAEVEALAKDKVVTFLDETSGREIAKVYTYAGGSVTLVDKVEGVTSAIVWDKTQEELLNIQSDVTVKATMIWKQCSVSFVVGGIFAFIPVEITFDPITDNYAEEIQLPTATVDNYAIVGWTDSENGNFAKYTDTYAVTADSIVLYAVWGGRTLKTEFYAEDGTTLLGTQNVEYNATVLFEGEAPEKEGYKFVGWDKSTVGVKEDTKFIAKYEKILAKVQVSVLGGTGAGRYTEGDTVTIGFRDIKGITFTGWKVVSGGVTITEKDGVYTFVVGAEDIVIEAVAAESGESSSLGCQASMSAGFVALALLCGTALVATKRKERD